MISAVPSTGTMAIDPGNSVARDNPVTAQAIIASPKIPKLEIKKLRADWFSDNCCIGNSATIPPMANSHALTGIMKNAVGCECLVNPTLKPNDTTAIKESTMMSV